MKAVLIALLAGLPVAGLILAQVEQVGDGLSSILYQLPLVGMVVALTFKFIQQNEQSDQRWREYVSAMTAGHEERQQDQAEQFRNALKEQREWYQSTLTLIMQHQNELASQIGQMANQLSMNSAVVGEHAKVNELVDYLAERAGAKEHR